MLVILVAGWIVLALLLLRVFRELSGLRRQDTSSGLLFLQNLLTR